MQGSESGCTSDADHAVEHEVAWWHGLIMKCSWKQACQGMSESTAQTGVRVLEAHVQEALHVRDEAG